MPHVLPACHPEDTHDIHRPYGTSTLHHGMVGYDCHGTRKVGERGGTIYYDYYLHSSSSSISPPFACLPTTYTNTVDETGAPTHIILFLIRDA